MKKYNLKIGDILLCKKDYIYSKISFSINKKYEIIQIVYNSLENNNNSVYYYVYDDNNSSIEIRNDEDMNRYFYTNQEVRNMKLKKIYEESES